MLNILGAERRHTHTRAAAQICRKEDSWVNCLPSETSEQRRSEAA